jgi:protein-arginine deiminase
MFKPLRYFPFFLLAAITSCYPKVSGSFLAASGPHSLQKSGTKRSEQPTLTADVNRDGIINSNDNPAAPWSWRGQGALVLPNVDDDNSDGQKDCADNVINNSADEKDLTHVELKLPASTGADDRNLQLTVSTGAAGAPVRLFQVTGSGWRSDGNSVQLNWLPAAGQTIYKFAVESCAFASSAWDGFMTVSLTNDEAETLAELKMRVSPFLMIPNTESAEKLFISKDLTNRYENTQMIRELYLPLLLNGSGFRVYKTDVWQEMWMQDTMEIGYSATPSSRMHVVLNAPRGHDRYGQTLLGADVGYIEVAEPRETGEAGDGWIDWFGNLEVSPPNGTFPQGRIYYGRNPRTGNSLHPDVVRFLEAQELQKPVGLDVSWLFIKHVDEMLSFWPDKKTGRFVATIPSPRLAAELLNQSPDDFNTSVQAELDGLRNGSEFQSPLRELFGIEEHEIVELPLSYGSGDFGATGQWSNPVNSVALSNTVLFGRTDQPEAINSYIKKSIGRLKLFPIGIDDSAYQPKLGNVHCATNTMRKIPKKQFWH